MYRRDALLVFIGVSAAVYGAAALNPHKFMDEPGWLKSSYAVSGVLLEGECDPHAWWWSNCSGYGNLNHPLPKLALGLWYRAGLAGYNAVAGDAEPPWDRDWDKRTHSPSGSPSGVHGVIARSFTSMWTGAAALLLYLVLCRAGRWPALAGAVGFGGNATVLEFGGQILTDSMYWAALMAGAWCLVRLGEATRRLPWFAACGLAAGAAGAAKIVGLPLSLLALAAVTEWDGLGMTRRQRAAGYAVALGAALLLVYLTCPWFYPSPSRVDIAGLAAEAGRLDAETLGAVYVAAADKHGRNRAQAEADWPNLYNAVGRPLELAAMPLRFATAQRDRAAAHPDMRVRDWAGVSGILLGMIGPLAPLALLGVAALLRAPSHALRVAAASAAVHAGFLHAALTVADLRYLMPACMFLILLAGFGIAGLWRAVAAPRVPAAAMR